MVKRLFVTAFVTIVAGFGLAVGCAVALAVIDIYLSGHGRVTLGRPWIDDAFVHMSRADCILCFVSLAAALTAGWATWSQLRRRGRAGDRGREGGAPGR